jgi:hypothetical protein
MVVDILELQSLAGGATGHSTTATTGAASQVLSIVGYCHHVQSSHKLSALQPSAFSKQGAFLLSADS